MSVAVKERGGRDGLLLLEAEEDLNGDETAFGRLGLEVRVDGDCAITVSLRFARRKERTDFESCTRRYAR